MQTDDAAVQVAAGSAAKRDAGKRGGLFTPLQSSPIEGKVRRQDLIQDKVRIGERCLSQVAGR